MRATRINHVSIPAADLEESARFYEQLFGVERLPTPNFGYPVLWLRLGDQQLHLFVQREEVPRMQHLAFDVDDFEAVYLRAKELGALTDELGSAIREHPAGWVQMYLRDPSGNLVEIDWPDVATLDRSVLTNIGRLEDEAAQSGDAAVATLYAAEATA